MPPVADPTPPSASASAYLLTPRLVALHTTPAEAWVTANNAVYDISLFLSSHPGGASALLPFLGTDITHLLAGATPPPSSSPSIQPHAHSAYALRLLEAYKIGDLAGGSSSSAATTDANIDPATGKQLVNWDKPLLPQIGRLGEKYIPWINAFPTTNHTVRMFPNEVIESLTKCAWWAPLAFWVPVAMGILWWYFGKVGGVGKVKWGEFGVLAAVGAVGWLLFEYALHRWAFHMDTKGYWGNIIHFLIHGHHHITPLDPDRVVFPPIPALLLGSPVWILSVQLMGFERGYAFLLGFLIGYLNYDMTHFWMHAGVPKSRFLKNQKSRHIFHHYHHPGVNYGISNPLFDHIFRTYHPASTKHIS